MRANGVRKLAAWCLGRGCNHHRVLDVSQFSDDVPVPSRAAKIWNQVKLEFVAIAPRCERRANEIILSIASQNNSL
jgi:hypothetical protein